MPGATELTNLGGVNFRWKNVYAKNGDFTGTLKLNDTHVSLVGHTHSGLVQSVTINDAQIDHRLLYTRASTDPSDPNVKTQIDYFFPEQSTSSSGTCRLGGPNHRWGALYSVNGEIQTSDRNVKRDIANINDLHMRMYDLLQPVSYKLIDGDRTHMGFISQDVQSAMAEAGLSDADFAGFCKDIVVDENMNQIWPEKTGKFPVGLTQLFNQSAEKVH